MTEDPPTVHRIEFDIEWSPGTAYAYLVDADEPVLVDAGGPEEEGWADLRAGLDEAGVAPADVAHLLVTHPHTDHDGQVARLVEAGDPTVYALADARDRLERDPDDLASTVRANAREVGFEGEAVTDAVEMAVDSLARNRTYWPPESVDAALAPGETFVAGDVAFEVLHAPGHQRDHACFAARLGDERALFAGDAVIEPFRAAALDVGLDAGTYGSIERFYATYDCLAERAFDRVYPGHGPVFSDYDGAVERSVASLDDLVAETAAALADCGPATPAAVARALRGGDAPPYVIFETVGALGYLERTGRAESRLENGVRYFATA